MAIKCKMPNCGNYTNHADGLCGYHYQHGAELSVKLDEEQLTPQEVERAKLHASQTFEQFSAQGEQRRREERERYEQACRDNYRTLYNQVMSACQQARSSSDFRQAFEGLKGAQGSLRETRPMKREEKDALLKMKYNRIE